MKILATNDPHQYSFHHKWKDLVAEVADIKPDIVAIAGDLMPKHDILQQAKYIKDVVKYVNKIKDHGSEVVLILGNDDNHNLEDEFKEKDSIGVWHYVHEKVKNVKGIDFCGLSYVSDYPFLYKGWCRAEFQGFPKKSPVQLGNPVTVDKNNKIVDIDDYDSYLKSYKSIYDSLIDLSQDVLNVNKSIWLIHMPPIMANLANVSIKKHHALEKELEDVGSRAVRLFIEEKQPLITIHGHIHENFDLTNGIWNCKIDKTLAIQNGQMTPKLYYSVIELNSDLEIVNYWHSNSRNRIDN